MIEKYLLYVLLTTISVLVISCSSTTSGSSANKGFLEKYKYTIKSKAQADEYAKEDDSFFKINDKKVDFTFEVTEDGVLQGVLSVKIDSDISNFLVFTPLIDEKKMKFQYYVSSYDEHKRILLNTGATKENVVAINIENKTLLFEIPKIELKQTKDGKESIFVEFKITQQVLNVGSASITLSGDEILIDSGDLGKKTYRVLEKLLNDNPNVKTIVLGNLDGSDDDEINVETGRMIRAKGLNTKVLANSDIASGAVDLFSSGVERIYTKGAKVRVHSWSGNGKTGAEYPKDDKAHHSQLGYFTAMLPETGYDFYFYTLNVAPFENVHTMSEGEIRKYKLATRIIK